MSPPLVSVRRPPIAVTGIGLVTSLGLDRETSWRALQAGETRVGWLDHLPEIPPGRLPAATVQPYALGGDPLPPGQLKVIGLCQRAAAEALADARLDPEAVDRERFGCSAAGHMGDTGFILERLGRTDLMIAGAPPWYEQWFPATAGAAIAARYRLGGPRTCHSTACASGLIEILAAARRIEDGQCDVALAGGGEAIHPLFAAGFEQMKVLAVHDDPRQASRPFDRARNGFVMGEGAGFVVLERLDHALARGAEIYAELLGGRMQAEAFHVTGLEADSDALAYTLEATLARAGVGAADVGYVNAHGTGTEQNDVTEARAIRRAFGSAADRLCVSSTKSMLGHLVNASGSVEFGVTALALRDGFVPPTINLTDQDPACELDCVPLAGRAVPLEHALKVSVAFGGHLAAAVLRRWRGPNARPAQRASTSERS